MKRIARWMACGLAALSTSSMAVAKPHARPAKASPTAACAFAGQWLERTLRLAADRPMVLADAAFQQVGLGEDLPSPAPRELVRAWTDAPASNLFLRCPELKSRLPANVRFATPNDRFVISFGAPILNRAGTAALIEDRSTCPGLCGNGRVTLFVRRGGKWIDRGPIQQWVS